MSKEPSDEVCECGHKECYYLKASGFCHEGMCNCVRFTPRKVEEVPIRIESPEKGRWFYGLKSDCCGAPIEIRVFKGGGLSIIPNEVSQELHIPYCSKCGHLEDGSNESYETLKQIPLERVEKCHHPECMRIKHIDGIHEACRCGAVHGWYNQNGNKMTDQIWYYPKPLQPVEELPREFLKESDYGYNDQKALVSKMVSYEDKINELVRAYNSLIERLNNKR